MRTELTTLYEIKKEIDHVTDRILGQYGLTLEQYLLLNLLEKSESTTTKIANILKVSKPAVSRRFRELHKKGWVARTKTNEDFQDDYRIVLYRLTSAGQKVLDDGNKSAEQLLISAGRDSLLDQAYQELRTLNQDSLKQSESL